MSTFSYNGNVVEVEVVNENPQSEKDLRIGGALVQALSLENTIEQQVDETGAVWFNAKDICDTLKHSNSRKALKDMVNTPDVTARYTRSSGQGRTVNFINESGLYSLILGSKLPKAIDFKHWVTGTVLPSIRKTGSYSINQPSSAGWVERSKNDASAVLAKIAARIYSAKLEKNSGSKPSTSDFQMLNIEVNKGAFNHHEKGMRNRMTAHGEERLENAYSTVVFELATDNIKADTYSKAIVRDHGKDTGVSILPESQVKQIKSERKLATKSQRKLNSKDKQQGLPVNKENDSDEDTNW
jgi:prophage antirepressor-like protein